MTRRPARTGLIAVALLALVALVAVFVPRILHPGRAEPMSPRAGLNFLDGRTGEVVGHLPVLVTSEVHYAPHPCSPRPENPAARPTMSPDIESPRSPPRILPGMAFPWDTLITAGFPVGGTLGGVWLKGHQDTDLDRRQATQAAEAAQAQKQQAAYTDLVVTARQALRNRRQLRLAYAADTPDEPEVREAFSQSGRHADKLNRAAATVEIVDSAAARVAVKAVYDNAKEVSEFYQHRSLTLAVVERNVGIPRGTGVIGFDSAEAQRLCDALADAVDSFITAVRPEPTNAGRPSRDTPGIRD
jgi:hypothetical protein